MAPNPLTMNVTITPVTLSAAVGQKLVNTNMNRCYLAIQNTGTGALSFGFDGIPAAGAGPSLDPASGAGGQGGSWEFKEAIPIDAVYGFSTAGTTVIVMEGINQAGQQ